ncbi:MAG: hypothetical protein HN580_20060 [Deltaproteobacteria bacterium]|jgi:hypothetical protein|nr:hypothetical protein [Deltaproteobacteria bacterium]MBT4641714.1 hypothetical protein [Deltaproteobacteria bacterium]MBT6499113.1 hypothetical protein [Deltaproteobacteria bacterium]MBT6612135.1 hypothetical protein [Deltaproteobacteria bacterium]MBT7151562.1 hypothetical protein [Deltaproteobacteria bacterium]
MKNKLLMLLCALLFWGLNSSAVELKRSEENLVDTNRYEEDYLFAGESLEFKGEARDLFFFTEQIDFSGTSILALTGLAREIDVTGNVNNGVKVGGRTIKINGNVKGTSFLGGEKVTFGQSSQTTGDTFVLGRKVTVSGKHRGDFYAGAAEISIQNEIKGDVTVHAGEFEIPEQGRIIGNLTYHSDQELSAEEASRVTGEIKFEKKEGGPFHDNFSDRFFSKSIWFVLLFKFSFIVFGLLVLLFPVNKLLERQYTRKEIQSHSLWGLIPLFVYPSAFLVSIVLLITLPLAVALLLAFMPIVFVTKTLGITIIGGYLAKRFNFRSTSRYLYFLIGVILYSLLSLIPFVGFLLLVFVTSIGCGLILSALFNKQLAEPTVSSV